MKKKTTRLQGTLVKTLWVVAMVLITLSLFVGGKPEEARYITAAIVTLMWLVFLLGFSGLTSLGRLRAMGAPASWWAVLALIIGVQVAMFHFVLTVLWQGSYLGAGIVGLFLIALFRLMLGFIQARRKAAQNAASTDGQGCSDN
jgi:hypothetical protein